MIHKTWRMHCKGSCLSRSRSFFSYFFRIPIFKKARGEVIKREEKREEKNGNDGCMREYPGRFF